MLVVMVLVVLNVEAWKPENTYGEMQNGISTHIKSVQEMRDHVK
jgi:hypothetical protein